MEGPGSADRSAQALPLSRHIVVGPTALDDVRSAMAGFWTDHAQVPRATRIEVGIAIGEVSANIIAHSTATGFQMQIQLLPDVVVIEFTDDGTTAQIDVGAARMPDWTASRGRGLAIAKAVLGRLDYFRDGDGNHWMLVSKPFSTG